MRSFNYAHCGLFATAMIMLIGSCAAIFFGFIEELSWVVGAAFGYFTALFQVVNHMAMTGKGWD